MIKIERGKIPENIASLLNTKREKKLPRIKELAGSGKLKSKDFNGKLWSGSGEVKKFLHKSQYGKCCYCERRRDQKGETDVEHFRPKAEVKEAGENHQGYWWLVYELENLFIACKKCNQEYKQTQFPLKDESKRAYTENCDLREEEPFLINPLEENPELLIDYDIEGNRPMAKAIGRCKRGEKTVNELTGINDIDVMLERAERLEACYDVCLNLKNSENDELRSRADKRLRKYISCCSEFSGFARFYFKKKGCL